MNRRAIIERAIGPVYESIDNGNYKKGSQKCTQILQVRLNHAARQTRSFPLSFSHRHATVALKLQRFPRDQLVRSLKAYCLSQLSPPDSTEALRIMKEIVEEGPEDDRILHTMSFVYKAVKYEDGVLEAYRSAVEKRPNEPGIRIGLFGAYVRRLEYINQQQESLRLAKMDPANSDMYVWWSICSLMMQCVDRSRGDHTSSLDGDGEGGADVKLLQLANSMAERQEKMKEKISYEKFLVMAEMLCGLGRHEDAVEQGLRFDRLCKDRVPASEKRALVGSLHVRAGDFGGASGVYLEGAIADPQDWIAWQMYLATVLPDLVVKNGIEKVEGLSLGGRIDGGIVEGWDRVHLKSVWEAAAEGLRESESVEGRLARARGSYETLRESYGSTAGSLPGGSNRPNGSNGSGVLKGSRSLLLAGLELAKYEFLHDDGQESLCMRILDAVPGLAVYSSFGADLRGYLAYLDTASKRRVAVEGLAACKRVAAELRNSAARTDDDDTQRHHRDLFESKAFVCVINGYVLQAETGAALAPASELVSLYYDHVHLARDYDPKDRGLGEELLVLAVGSLIMESFEKGSSIELALQLGLVFIQAAQQARHVSAPLRLAASAIYGLLGADELASAEFAALDIKGVLHDSLTGHWLVPMLLASCPSEASCAKWWKGIDQLHTAQAQEARDALFTVYEEQTYSKVPEFVDFIHRLDKSSTLYLYKSEAGISRFREACLSVEDISSLESTLLRERVPDAICFNDDLTVRPLWYPPSLDGPLFEVHGWWERVYGERFPWTSEGGLSATWWVSPCESAVVPSGERAEWERTLKRQLTLRLAFPNVMSLVCTDQGQVESSAAATVPSWITEALEAAGMIVKMNPGDSAGDLAKALTGTIQDPSTRDIDTISYLRVLIVLVGYDIGSSNASIESTMTGLEHLAEAIRAVQSRCEAAIATKRHAGIPFAARLATEEFVWIAQILGCSKIVKADDSVKVSIRSVAKALGDSIEVLGTAVSVIEACEEIRNTIAHGNHALSGCMHYISDYDVGSCLTALAAGQTATIGRVADALARISNKLNRTLFNSV